MDTQAVSPQNFEERIIWYSITYTYGFYLIGGLYVLAPVVGWVLLGYLGWRLWSQDENTPARLRIRIPAGVWVWTVAMLVMLAALIIGHIDWELGFGKTLKSTIGWAKGWALMAVFPLIGCLNIRPAILYRAAARVCLHTLILMPFLYAAYLLGLPQSLYISPIQLVGGPGPEFFTVSLYNVDYEGVARWFLFAPWAPALGFVANVYLLFALQEREKKWFWIGILGCIVMVLICKSRLALLVMVLIPWASWALSRLTQTRILLIAGAGSLVAGMAAPFLLRLFEDFAARFRAARVDSSRVRETLARIALDRWQGEAPIWGHGIVERGPHLVEYMPIGSHHTWYGLLFVKGAVGFAALAVALLWSFVELLLKAQTSQTAKTGLGVVMLLFLYTFGENLEILAYLFWPGLVLIGIAHREALKNPLKDTG
ncbi:MAG: O-antigen ligase domain-containing protein [Candidatus Thiodiazotropha sp. (ex Dulcina madagascariensis)]|nr:O-antigen ligase domain-containing protein [Candidatus Thiodiazotropha sp. (ex Dulcina madagascariensis)]MCU7929018.1 O-antigen ligase domain-containing protein [Candidatus Thiodiazotropha sp. (ex Dulcina madagascariensis)]